MLRIVHIFSEVGHGGGWEVIRQLSMRQAATGHDVVVAARWASKVLHQFDGSVKLVEFAPRPRSRTDIQVLFDVRRVLKNFSGPTVLHAHSPIALLAGSILGERSMARVYTNHFSPPLSPWRSRIKSLILRNADVVVTPSVETSEQVRKEHRIPPEKVRVIPLAADSSRFYPASDAERAAIRAEWGVTPDAIVVAFVGRLDLEKRVHWVLQFTRKASELGRNVFAVICGSGPCESSLKDLAHQLGIESRVRFLGYLKEPRRVYAGSDINVLPSIFETFALTVIEGFLCGTPAFRSDSGGWSSQIVVGETGRAFPRDSEDAFHDGLMELVTDSTGLKLMSRRTRAFALDRFSMATFAKRMDALYLECLAGKTAAPVVAQN
jgi:glycosyltransferase involved in cell wall biosynthesis